MIQYLNNHTGWCACSADDRFLLGRHVTAERTIGTGWGDRFDMIWPGDGPGTLFAPPSRLGQPHRGARQQQRGRGVPRQDPGGAERLWPRESLTNHGGWMATDPVVVADSANLLRIFAADAGGNLWQRVQSPTGFTGWKVIPNGTGVGRDFTVVRGGTACSVADGGHGRGGRGNPIFGWRAPSGVITFAHVTTPQLQSRSAATVPAYTYTATQAG